MKETVFNKIHPVAIGSDHAGFDYKEQIVAWLEKQGWLVANEGTFNHESCDYPDYAHAVATSVASRISTAGILICGSGNGVCMTANKHEGIRAALCWNEEITALARSHNDANILCIPARYVSIETAIKMTELFLTVPFEGGRHQRRVEKI